MMNLYITYPELKIFYPTQIIDLRHQVDQITPRKIQLFVEVDHDPNTGSLFFILVRHRQVAIISNDEKVFEVKVI